MNKLKMHSPDLTQRNIEKLRELYPGCVKETKNETTGELRLSVDLDQLRYELGDHQVEGSRERYHLDWPGKREALALANAPVNKSLRPILKQSLDFETTKNLFIEGNNLDVLKLLQETYLGKVKFITIDPPYNTGKDFIYSDDFSESRHQYLVNSGQLSDVWGGGVDYYRTRKQMDGFIQTGFLCCTPG